MAARFSVSLRAHVAGDDLLGGGIDGDLSGSKNQALGSNGLRVRANSFRSLVGGDHFAHDSSCLLRFYGDDDEK